MNEQTFSRFEARLERLIEGTFALLSKGIRAQDIALHLARALESAAASGDGDPRPIAPDFYTIRLHPDARTALLARQPTLAHILSQHLVDLAGEMGYRMAHVPTVELVDDPDLLPTTLTVSASVTRRAGHTTAVMRRNQISLPAEDAPPHNAQLIINGERTIVLTAALINIGRAHNNQIILDDPYVSRHHAQLRLRFGRYTLFDVQSNSGLYVNDTRVREHRLQTGDVVRIGRQQLVYLEDDPLSESQTNAAPSLDEP